MCGLVSPFHCIDYDQLFTKTLDSLIVLPPLLGDQENSPGVFLVVGEHKCFFWISFSTPQATAWDMLCLTIGRRLTLVISFWLFSLFILYYSRGCHTAHPSFPPASPSPTITRGAQWDEGALYAMPCHAISVTCAPLYRIHRRRRVLFRFYIS